MTLNNAVEQIGKTAEDVAITLRNAKCKGKKGDPYGCPVANYLRENKGVQATVRTFSIRIYPSVDERDGRSIMTPLPIRAFIADFDRGCYPELMS